MKRVSRIEFIENQKDYYKTKKLHFLLTNNGYCKYCGADIVIELMMMGYKLGNEGYVSRCPDCGLDLK